MDNLILALPWQRRRDEAWSPSCVTYLDKPARCRPTRAAGAGEPAGSAWIAGRPAALHGCTPSIRGVPGKPVWSAARPTESDYLRLYCRRARRRQAQNCAWPSRILQGIAGRVETGAASAPGCIARPPAPVNGLGLCLKGLSNRLQLPRLRRFSWTSIHPQVQGLQAYCKLWTCLLARPLQFSARSQGASRQCLDEAR